MSDIPTMNDEGLLECPLCDSSDSFLECDSGLWRVACGNCECFTGDRLNKLSAVKAWNTRKGHLWTVDDFKQMNAERNIRE